jgi:hypothetical protein
VRERIEDSHETGNGDIAVDSDYRGLDGCHELRFATIYSFVSLASSHLYRHILGLVRLPNATRNKYTIITHHFGLGVQIPFRISVLMNCGEDICFVIG